MLKRLELPPPTPYCTLQLVSASPQYAYFLLLLHLWRGW